MADASAREPLTSEEDPLAADIDQTLEEALSRELVPAAMKGAPGALEAVLPRRGSLSGTGLPLLLGTAYRIGASGRLLIERRSHQHALDLDSGWVVAVTSSDPELGLLAMLVRQGRITSADRDRLRSEALLTGRRPGAIAVERGLLKSAELLPALRRHQEEMLLGALGFVDGSFAFDPEGRSEPAQLRLHRHPLALIRAGLGRRVPASTGELLAAMGGEGARLLLVAGLAAQDVLEQAAAGPGDGELLALFDGLRTLSDVIKRSQLGPDGATALAFALWSGGHLVPGDEAHRKRLLRDRRIDRERIRVRAALARGGDYFEVLGLSPAASGSDVARAVVQVAEDLEAALGDADLPASLREEVDDVRLVTEEAARVLGDERLRALYQAGRVPVAGDSGTAAAAPPASAGPGGGGRGPGR